MMGFQAEALEKVKPGAGVDVVARFLWSFDRNHGPDLLAQLRRGRRIDTEQLRAGLVHAWTGAEYPCLCLPRGQWLKMFREAGFVTEGDHAKPTAPVEVWRSQVGRTVGLAWTWCRDQAEWFHERNVRRGFDARLLHGFAPPESVLAILHAPGEGRGEKEVVIDPSSRFWTRGKR